MNWEVIADADARKQLKRIPRRDAERIRVALREFAVNPYAGDIRKMEGEGDVWRRRSGVYRILYEVRVKARIVYVLDIRRRTSSTY